MRLSVGVFTLENRRRLAGGFLTGGSARASVRATRDFLTAGKRTPFFRSMDVALQRAHSHHV